MTAEAVSWASAAGIIAVVGVATWLINRWVSELNRNVERADAMSDIFYDNANTLIDDKRTPLAVSKFLVGLSSYAKSHRFSDWVVKNSEASLTASPHPDFSQALEELPSELRGKFAICVMSSLIVSASSRPFAPDSLNKKLFEMLQQNVIINDPKKPNVMTFTIPCPDDLMPEFPTQEPELVKQAAAQYVFEHDAKQRSRAREFAHAY